MQALRVFRQYKTDQIIFKLPEDRNPPSISLFFTLLRAAYC